MTSKSSSVSSQVRPLSPINPVSRPLSSYKLSRTTPTARTALCSPLTPARYLLYPPPCLERSSPTPTSSLSLGTCPELLSSSAYASAHVCVPSHRPSCLPPSPLLVRQPRPLGPVQPWGCRDWRPNAAPYCYPDDVQIHCDECPESALDQSVSDPRDSLRTCGW